MITTGTPKTNRSALPLEIQQNTSASRVEKKKRKRQLQTMDMFGGKFMRLLTGIHGT